MKKIVLLAVVLFSVMQYASAQMVMGSETFDATTFAPPGWKITPDSTPALNIWRRLTSGTNPSCNPKGGAAMARFTSRAYIAGTKQQLVSRPIDYSNRGTSPANISFWMYRDSINTNFDSLTVWVNNADSLNSNALKLGTICRYRGHMIPDTQVTNGWFQYTFAIPTTYTGNMTTRFIFEGTSQTPVVNQGAQIFIDQLLFEEYPLPCSGIPNSGNIIKSNPIICSGAGSSNLSLSSPLAVSGLSYNWLASVSSTGPWVSLATTAVANTGNLTSTMYYTCEVTCSNSSMTYTTSVDSIVVLTSPTPTITVNPSPAVICPGSTGVVLTASGALNYAWTPAVGLSSAVGSTVTALPTSNTQYTVAGIDALGCTATTTVNVGFGTAPNLSMSASPNDSVCNGGQVILNCINGNPGNNTFLWNTGATTRRDTLIITASAMYSVVVTNTVGCTSTDSIYITALPPQTSGFTYSNNANNTYTFTDTTTSGSNWFWTLPGGLFSNTKSVNLTFPGAGSYTITLVVTGTCKRDTITKVIEVSALSLNNMAAKIGATCYPNPASNVLHITAATAFIEKAKITNLTGQEIWTQEVNNNAADINIMELTKGIYQIHLSTDQGNATLQFVKD